MSAGRPACSETPSTSAFGPREPPGTGAAVRDERIGRYRLVRKLASGGMATLYLATVEGPDRFVRALALKRIHSHLADDPDFIEMFADEARLLARISHPNVCGIIDFGRSGEDYFIALEHLRGVTLAAVARRLVRDLAARPPHWPAHVAAMIAEACRGLHAAHELRDEHGRSLGVIHRDISPDNLFATFDGEVKVLDFGIALASDRSAKTRTAVLKGKPSYIAPEQLHGLPLDRRADVWSLGVTLWELLALRRLFKRDNEVVTLRAVSGDPIPSLEDLGVEPELARIVARALEREVDRRWASAQALGQALQEWLARGSSDANRRTSQEARAELVAGLFPAERAEQEELVRSALRAGAASTATDPTQTEAGGAAGGASTSSQRLRVAVRPEVRPGGFRVGAVVAAGALVALVSFTVGSWRSGMAASTEAAAEAWVPPPLAEPLGSQEPPEPSGRLEPGGADPAVDERESPAIDEPGESDEVEVAPPALAEAPVETRRVRRRAPPQPREPAGSAAPSESGTVSIVTRGGWADVLVGGSVIGRTPGRFELPAGVHRLTLRPSAGRDPVERTVRVMPGAEVRVVVEL